jgi:hypothetical protein
MISNGICGNPIQIAIDGLLNTGTTIIDEFFLVTGSQTFQEQPQPATIVIRGRGRFAVSNRFLGRRIGLLTQDPVEGFKYIFVGQVTSIANNLVTDDEASFEISAVSYLNELLTLDGGSNGFPAQDEIERLNAIFENVTANEWQDFDTVTTWAALGQLLPTTTWAEFTSFYARNFEWDISGVGEYDLSVYPLQQSTGYDLVTELISNIRGRLYEVPQVGTTTAGKTVFEYKSRTTMQNDIFTPYLTIGTHNVLRDSMAINADIANMANNVILDNGTAIRSDANYSSIDRFGLRQVYYETQLANAADLQTFATEFMKSAAFTRDLVTTVGVVINETTTTIADAYKAIDCIWQPLPIQIDDVPSAIAGRFGQTTQWALPVGSTASYANGNLIVQYNLAISTQVKPATRWLDLDPTTAWNAYATPTKEWQDIQ